MGNINSPSRGLPGVGKYLFLKLFRLELIYNTDPVLDHASAQRMPRDAKHLGSIILVHAFLQGANNELFFVFGQIEIFKRLKGLVLLGHTASFMKYFLKKF